MTNRRIGAVVLSLLCAVLEVGAKEVPLNGHVFTLPDGFSIELVAGPPMIDRPIVADFDEQGRLYVAESSGSNDKVQKQLEEKPHRIVRLEDTDGDGRFDHRVVFAERMMFPEGALWHDGSLYVSAPPSIWKLTDTDDDGVVDQREEWFEGKTLTGCANDLHGPYLGPDGWIYWCKGAFAEQTYERAGKAPFVTRAAHIFRRRPEGGEVEPVMTGGMDNPVDVVFTPGGERVFTTTFLQHPGGGRRDGLIHALYGGVYGKVHGVLDGHPRTGEILPALSHLGAAAPCGLTRYESAVFGPAFENNLFACLFNMHKVTRHSLEPHGASFKSRDEDFVVSNKLDFHPTDVLEDADGSLIVIDTGGWYKLCCPTSQLWKPDVLGAIYRIRRDRAPRVDDPRGLALDWSTADVEDLAKLLDDDRPAVRRRAVHELAKRGAGAIPTLSRTINAEPSARARLAAVWALTRIDHPTARASVRSALTDADETVRQAALNSVSVRRDGAATDRLLDILATDAPHPRRVAAEALGRIGAASAIPALLDAASTPHGRSLEHSLIFALIEIADPSATATGLKSDSSTTRRAALIALDQMEGGGLEPDAVASLLASPDPVLKETAAWIVDRHPEWGDALTGFLRARLGATSSSDGDHDELQRQLTRFARSGAVQRLLAECLRDRSYSNAAREIVLRAMADSGLKEAPDSWVDVLSRLLGDAAPSTIAAAVSTSRALTVPKERGAKLVGALVKVAHDGTTPAKVRLDALAAVPGGLTEVEPSVFEFLRGHFRPEVEVARRSAAADVFAAAKLSPVQLAALADSFASVGPLESNRLLPAFEQSTDEALGLKLVAALKRSSASSGARIDVLANVFAKYPAPVRERADELYALLDVDVAKKKQLIEALLGSLQGGDVRRGQAVFNGKKTACSACHAIGYLGGKVGPDLTRIARIRTERDLLEAIVFPSASFVRSYEPVLIATVDGRILSGVVVDDSADEIVVATAPNEQIRIAKADIETMQPGTVSVMPASLDKQITRGELADLIAFLKACK